MCSQGSSPTSRPRILSGLLAALALVGSAAHATPSSTLWTNMTLDIQSYGVLHIGVDNYFTAFKKASAGGSSFPVDAGLTIGVLPFDKFQMEVGVDLLESSDYPAYFNLKMGSPEGVLFKGSPALEVGIFNVGTQKDVTNQNVVDLVIGKSIPNVGRLSVGPYIGNSRVLVNGEGKKDNSGWMAAFDRGFHATKGADGQEFNRFVIATDYASGKNAIGGGSVGLYYYFTKDISLLAGHVWFNDEAINGKSKWTIQLDINLPSWADK
jgi:hypothetical protein